MRRFALALMLVACSTASLAAPLGEGVIVPLEKGIDLLNQCSREVPDTSRFWVPTAAQIADLENGFDAAVAAALKPRDEQPPADGYDRQYIGIVVGGQQRIYVNAYAHVKETPEIARSPYNSEFWKKNAVQVCGGGSYYFGAVFDPAAKSFSNFEFNGLR